MFETTLATILTVALQTGRLPSPAPTPEPLTFASDIRMIRLDVSVVDRNGQPVRGLNARDFTILENGKPVELSVFEAMEDGALATSMIGADGGMSLSVRSEGPLQRLSGQRIVIVADPSGLSPMQLARVRDGSSDFLARQAQEGDVVRLINLATREVTDGRIPADRMRLAAAARAISRHKNPLFAGEGDAALDSFANQIDFDQDKDVAESYSQSLRSERFLSQFSRTNELLSLFDEVLIQLAGIPGRKSLIFISEGFPDMRTLDERLERTAHLAREAQAVVHYVDAYGLDDLLPEGPSGRHRSIFETAWARSAGSQNLAEATGGSWPASPMYSRAPSRGPRKKPVPTTSWVTRPCARTTGSSARSRSRLIGAR